MKKLLVVLLAVTMLFGCGKKGGKDDVPPVDETQVVINDLEFHMDKETSYKNLFYTVVGDFKEIENDISVPYVQYNYYQEDDTNLLFFRIFYYQNKNVDAAVKDLGIEGKITFEDGNNGSIDYKLYVQPRDDGGTIHFYFITRDKDTYVLHFVSRYDIKDFEEKVIRSLHF